MPWNKPTKPMLRYLRLLAQQKGETYAVPSTFDEARVEIERLKALPSSTSAERAIDRREIVRDQAHAGSGEVRSPGGGLKMPENELVSVRYMVDDVEESIDFYTSHFGFTLRHSALPAFADVVRGRLRLLLAGPASSAGRPMPDGRKPEPGGWNRIHLIVDDIASEVEQLRSAGLPFRNDIVSGPGGLQILVEDPSGNPIELFQPAETEP